MHRKIGLGAALLISALVAGCAPRGATPPAPPPAQTGEEDQPGVVGIVLREFAFEPRPLKVKTGTVRFLLMNRGTVEHDFAILALQGHDEHEKHLVRPGETKTVEIELPPGTYEAICTVPGHKEAGMAMSIEVSS